MRLVRRIIHGGVTLRATHSIAVARRAVGSTATGPDTTPPSATPIAPRRVRRTQTAVPMDTSELLRHVPREPGAHAELSSAELERKLADWSRLHPRELAAAVRRLEAQEERSSRVLQEDALYQMDVSLRPRSGAATRVFWRDVGVAELASHPGWYTVTVDGRKVKAFESSRVLAVPSEAVALCCAREYAEQKDFVNKLLMPMTDLCSGAMHVAPQMLIPRIDYLMSFLQNDNLYFRAPPIVAQQDALIEPIAKWFTATYGVPVPRIIGIGHPHLTPQALMHVRDALVAMQMNPYQVVALCVAAQFTSSVLLPLALFHGVVDLPTALRINGAEEGHNIAESGLVKGYHDIREADAVVKICACATAWRMLCSVPLSVCVEGPMQISGADGADDV